MKYVKKYKELFEDSAITDTYNGPNITTWSGDGIGTSSIYNAPNSGKIGAEFDSIGDVTSLGELPKEINTNKPIIPKKLKNKRKSLSQKLDALLKPKI